MKRGLRADWEDATGGNFDLLPSEAKTVIFSVAYQYGRFNSQNPNWTTLQPFWNDATQSNWTAAAADLRDWNTNDQSIQDRRDQEADLLDRISSPGSPVSVNEFGTPTSPNSELLAFQVPYLPANYVIDPSGSSTYTLAADPSSPNFATVDLPSLSGATSYNLRVETGSSWGAAQNVAPGQTVQLPSGADGIQVQTVDANGNPIASSGPISFDVTFASTGTFSGTLQAVAFSVLDTTSNTPSNDDGQAYTGPVNYLQWQYIWPSQDNVNVTANVPNVFLKSGPGEDALQAVGGSNVLDGGTGSNFLVGATGADGGTDTFFTDARNNTAVWNTLVNFHAGDAATLWGFDPSVSTWYWDGISGAAGYTGATLRADVHGTGTVDASITFAGLTMAQAQNLQVSTGSINGLGYLYFHNPGV